MLSVTVLLCFLQLPAGTPRTGHDSPVVHRSDVPVVAIDPEPTALTPAQQKAMLRRFESRFNKLVEAVEEFSLAYNESKGQAWPAAKAEALRKAMAELQKADPNLKPAKN